MNAAPGTIRRVAKPAAIYALVEVSGRPELQADPDPRAYQDADGAAIAWRAPIRIMANLRHNPVPVDLLPAEYNFDLLRRPLMTSTIPAASFSSA